MSAPLCRLQLTSRASVDVATGLIDSAADVLGFAAPARIRLQAFFLEVIGAVVRDAFTEGDEIDLDVEVHREAGTMRIELRDRGAPLDFGAGGYPPRVADLIRLGFADRLTFYSQGRAGNLTVITKELSFDSVDQEFIEETKASPTPPPQLGDDGLAVLDIRKMTADDVVAVARLFYRCYGYSVSYAPVVYQPEKLRELVDSGRHIGTVAVAPEGTIIGHVATETNGPGAIVGEAGLLAVDPQYRGHKVTMRMGLFHIGRLYEAGFVGQYSRAVTVHTRSQQSALQAGGRECGLVLAAQSGDLEFRGFETAEGQRKAVVMFYGSFGNTPERAVYVPLTYAQFVERIYSHANLPRTVIAQFERSPDIPDETSQFNVSLRHETGIAMLAVRRFGKDFLESLQTQVQQLRLNRFELVIVEFPLADPLTAHFGAGLHELGLSFASVMPEYDDGDVLWLQHLNNVEVVPEDIHVASEFGEELRRFVLADKQQAAERVAVRDRSRVHMSRIYEVLD